MNKLDDPVFVEYWMLNFRLTELKEQYCNHCNKQFICWRYGGGASYSPEDIQEICRVEEVKRVTLKLKELSSKRDAFYFGASGDEIEKLEEMFRQSIDRKL